MVNYTGKQAQSALSCRLCGTNRNIDFHHWSYSPEIGTYLCRDCHEYIHKPDGARPSETRGQSWLWGALEQLVDRHTEIVEEPSTVPDIMDRYNVPSAVESIVRRKLNQTLPEDERRRRHERSVMEEWADIECRNQPGGKHSTVEQREHRFDNE